MWKHCTLFMSYNLAIEKLAIEDQRKQKSTYRKTKYRELVASKTK